MNRGWSKLGASPALLAVGAGASARAARARRTRPRPRSSASPTILQSTLVAHGGEVQPLLREGAGRHAGRRGQDRAGRRRRRRRARHQGRARARRGEVAGAAGLPEESAADLDAWSGIDPGSTVIVPLAFEGQAAQFSVKVADAPDHGPPAPSSKARGAAGAGAAVLGQAAGRRGDDARAAGVAVAADRVARQPHRDAQAPGRRGAVRAQGPRARAGPRGRRAREARRGRWRSSSRPACRTRSRTWAAQAPAVLLEIFAPMGPETRLPRSEGRGGARGVRGHPRPAARRRRPRARSSCVASVDGARPSASRLVGRQGAGARRCSTPSDDRQQGVYVGILEAEPGRRGPAPHPRRHRRRSCTSLSGAGELTIGSEKIPFGAEQALHIPGGPAARRRSSPAPRRPIMLQVFAPAGPEKRTAGPSRPARNDKGPRPMIDFDLTDDQRVLQKSVRELCERLIIPNARAAGTRKSASRTRSSRRWARWACSACRSPRSTAAPA